MASKTYRTRAMEHVVEKSNYMSKSYRRQMAYTFTDYLLHHKHLRNDLIMKLTQKEVDEYWEMFNKYIETISEREEMKNG